MHGFEQPGTVVFVALLYLGTPYNRKMSLSEAVFHVQGGTHGMTDARSGMQLSRPSCDSTNTSRRLARLELRQPSPLSRLEALLSFVSSTFICWSNVVPTSSGLAFRVPHLAVHKRPPKKLGEVSVAPVGHPICTLVAGVAVCWVSGHLNVRSGCSLV